ncbi:hypothetical protein [Dactylosporangium sp. NPDC006015]|uniref:hypothetical protein n=1 Tax=Dactylosporangium sp. NPDC006015 TaxID=3154576 RepID=UPI0033A39746
MGGEAEARQLFDAFRDELWGQRHWDSDFTPAPHEPDLRLRELVDGAGVAAVPEAIGALGDETLLVHLLPMLHEDRLSVSERNAVIAAFANYGERGRALIGGEGAVRRIEDADDTFLRGRIETTLGGAFDAYAGILLVEPAAPAAFQLAWIDRAYGAPVTAARVAWIRGLGFADEDLLAEVARPVRRPLEGLRIEWDCGRPGKHHPARAARAAAAGLPSLASGWLRHEAHAQAARIHLDKVRAATDATS